MTNQEINTYIKKEGVFKWQIARKLCIHEGTFSCWFRDELTPEQVKMVLNAIEEIKIDRLRGK